MTEDGEALEEAKPGPRLGDVLDGKYALKKVLGEGGMGIVFEAEHLRLKQRCAIKILAPRLLADVDIVRRFEREARASAQLKSPHVTRVSDVSTTAEGFPYMVMELLDGYDLDVQLERGPLPVGLAVDYVLQACAAVAEAHAAGIIHRDLKPANLFLANEADGACIKVLDFGISKMVDEDTKLTTAGSTMGTALYMSPEQIRSAAKVDARADIWSLGVILYELLCGTPPFTGTVHQIAAAIVSDDAPNLAHRCVVPRELALAVHRMLERDPFKRYQTIADVAIALGPHAPEGSRGAALIPAMARRSSTRLPTPPPSGPISDRVVVRAEGSDPRDVAQQADARTEPDDVPTRRTPRVLLAIAALAVLAGASALVVLTKPFGSATTASSATPSMAPPPSVTSAPPAMSSTAVAATTASAPIVASADPAASTKTAARKPPPSFLPSSPATSVAAQPAPKPSSVPAPTGTPAAPPKPTATSTVPPAFLQ